MLVSFPLAALEQILEVKAFYEEHKWIVEVIKLAISVFNFLKKTMDKKMTRKNENEKEKENEKNEMDAQN